MSLLNLIWLRLTRMCVVWENQAVVATAAVRLILVVMKVILMKFEFKRPDSI